MCIRDRLLGESQTKQPILQKNTELEATIVAISKSSAWFNIGGKALAILGDRETKEISTYLPYLQTVSYTHLRAHETVLDIVCRLLLANQNHISSPRVKHLSDSAFTP